LIDETTRTFKKGLIVTATVTKVFDNKVICRLENGLNAIIPEEAILEDTN
jgi:ribosomal protein S1